MFDENEFYPQEPRSPRRRSCWFLGFALLIIVGLLASSFYSVYWFFALRQEPTAVSPAIIVEQKPSPTAEPPTTAVPPEETAVPDSGEELAVSSAELNRIVLINEDAHVETVAPDGSDRRVLTAGRRIYQFPAWSPDGAQIAVIGNDRLGGGVYVLRDEPDPAVPLELYSGGSNRAPFYLYWSPDSEQISFLASDPDDTLTLNLVNASGEEKSQAIATGSPFYWNWTSDGSLLFIHTGASQRDARLLMIDELGRDRTPSIPAPGNFQAPGVSVDGRYWAYSQLRTGDTSWLVVTDTWTGEQLEKRHAGALALGWSPNGEQLAFISGEAGSSGFWGALRLLEVPSGEERVLSEETVLAFFWSPDGRKIAYISSPDQDLGGIEVFAPADTKSARRLSKPVAQRLPEMNLSVIDVQSGQGLQLATFTPSHTFISQFLPFFDQYALSHRLWSPGSDAIVLPIVEQRERKIVVVPIGGGQMRQIGTGSIAFWSQN